MMEDTPYEPPALFEYGDIEELTRQTGPNKNDNNRGSGKPSGQG